jgi:hypothetical protein
MESPENGCEEKFLGKKDGRAAKVPQTQLQAHRHIQATTERAADGADLKERFIERNGWGASLRRAGRRRKQSGGSTVRQPLNY